MQNSYDGKNVAAFLRNAKGLIPGSVAPEIEGTDINGKIFCLENLKGKYIIHVSRRVGVYRVGKVILIYWPCIRNIMIKGWRLFAWQVTITVRCVGIKP